MSAERCVPCEDGRKLLLAALAARAAWALLSRRLGGGAAVPLPALAASVAASALTPVLAYRLALNLRLSRAAALLAGAALALDPASVFLSARAPGQSLFAALAAGFLLAWVYAWRSGRPRDAAFAGVMAGAATLARGAMIPFAVLLVLVALARRREQPRWAALAASGVLCWAAAAATGFAFVRAAPNLYSEFLAAGATFGVGHAGAVFTLVLLLPAALGLRAALPAPGGWFLLAWPAHLVFQRAFDPGLRLGLCAAPVLAVFAGAGLAAMLRLD